MTLVYLDQLDPDGNLTVPAPRGAALDPLLAEASLLLRSASVSGYTAGDPWVNEGTLGSAHDAEVASGVGAIIPTWEGDGFRIGATPTEAGTQGGFVVAHHADLDIPTSGGVTILTDFTPESSDADSYKWLWKYPAGDLPTSAEGWVIEHVDNLGGGPGTGGWLIATFDGAVFAAIIADDDGASTRRQLAFVVNSTADTAAFYKDGSVGTTKMNANWDTLGDVTTTADLILSGRVISPDGTTTRTDEGVIFHNLAIWPRALTAQEIADAGSALA